MPSLTPEEINALLPQTQCGLCGYGGCLPYAEAIVFEQAKINLCPPGGIKTLAALGELVQQPIQPYLSEMQQKTKPLVVARIREEDCIGCTKCIQACPVDAILGSSKSMHTVIADECTGCELCVAPCPVDCIEIISVSASEMINAEMRTKRKSRFEARQQRLAKVKNEKKLLTIESSLVKKKNYVAEALVRAKNKKYL